MNQVEWNRVNVGVPSVRATSLTTADATVLPIDGAAPTFLSSARVVSFCFGCACLAGAGRALGFIMCAMTDPVPESPPPPADKATPAEAAGAGAPAAPPVAAARPVRVPPSAEALAATAAAEAVTKSLPPIITSLSVAALPLMKIVKHCEDTFPLPVAGQLLGMDVDRVLEVTNCYGFPGAAGRGGGGEGANPFADPTGDDAAACTAALDQSQYQTDMMRCVQEVNIDPQVVGWYTSTGASCGAFLTQQWIETQFSYQNQLRNAVCLVHDPVRTSEGTLCLSAVRLTDAFMGVFRRGDFSSAGFSLASVDATRIVSSVPITLATTSLSSALLVDCEYAPPFSGADDVELSRLGLNDRAGVEASLEYAIGELDGITREQGRYPFFLRSYVRASPAVAEKLRAKRLAGTDTGPVGADDEETGLAGLLASESSRLESKMVIAELTSVLDTVKLLASEEMGKQSCVGSLQTQDVLGDD